MSLCCSSYKFPPSTLSALTKTTTLLFTGRNFRVIILKCFTEILLNPILIEFQNDRFTESSTWVI